MKYDYRKPKFGDKPPSRNSKLGMIIMALDDIEFRSSREVFRRAFLSYDNFDSCKAMFYIATQRELIEREHPERQRPNRHRLSAKGATVKEAMKNSR